MKKIFLVLALFGVFSLQAAVTNLTTESFAGSTKEGFVVVDFFTDWCGPCKAFAPDFLAASEEMGGKVRFGKVNATNDQRLLDQFNINSIPTVILFRDGKEVKRFVGPKKKHDLIQWLQQAAG